MSSSQKRTISGTLLFMGATQLTTTWPQGRGPSAKLLRLSPVRGFRGVGQVAAVCYRVRGDGIQFLLVRTRGGGRWTFPKGGVEPGLTYAQSAALEAFEEAGVHGRMEDIAFARYYRRPRGRARDTARSDARELTVRAHLCEVLRLGPPQESNRNPTWFSAEKAKRRLRQERSQECGTELTRVVDRALVRIRPRIAKRNRPN